MSLSISFPLSKPLRLAVGVRHRPTSQQLHCHVAALLIMSLFGYVAGITNGISPAPSQASDFISDSVINTPISNSANSDSHVMGNHNLAYYNNVQRTTERHITPPTPLLDEAHSIDSGQGIDLRSMQKLAASGDSVFRPSPIIDFTLSDATATRPHYPPSYLDPVSLRTTQPTSAGNLYQLNYSNNLNDDIINTAINSNANNRNDGAILYGTQSNSYASLNLNANANTNANGNARPSQLKFPNEHRDSVSTVPPQLRTTPILSYRDPFTNQNYQYQEHASTSTMPPFPPSRIETYHVYETTSSPNYNNNYDNYNYLEQREPQEYTVQSSMFVGLGSNANNRQPVNSAVTTRPGYRPGYVVDDVDRPNYQQYLQAAATHGNQQQQQQLEQYTVLPKPKAKPQTNPTTERLSYDSHDYPPPSYQHLLQREQQKPQQQLRPTPPAPTAAPRPPPPPPPPRQQQQPLYQQYQSPHRQDVANYGPGSALGVHGPASPNYANNFGNYLQQANQQQQQQQQHYTGNYKRPPASYYEPHAAAGPPNSNNYYEYQLGEIPPQQPGQFGGGAPPPPFNYQRPLAARPPFPQAQSQAPATSGLASLASLFTTTQQYAPQFTNLLLGAITGGGGGAGGYPSSSPFGSSPNNKRRPHNMQLIKALENIARNDDLECVPKVLCQTIAGQTERGQLPGFITSPAITNFLAGFPASSPALIYGRAALLAISGGEKGCSTTYTKCPKSEYEILYYLNNHRGGFFKFFSEPDEQQSTAAGASGQGQTSAGGSGGSSMAGMAGSLWNILSAFAGNAMATAPITTSTTTPRPSRRPVAPSVSSDISSGIGNFFTQVLSDYLSGVEYQRRRRRRRRQAVDEDGGMVLGKMEGAAEQYRAIEQETEGRAVESWRPDVGGSEPAKDLPEDFHDEEDDEDTNPSAEELGKDYGEVRQEQQFEDVEGRILSKEQFAIDRPKFFPEATLSNDGAAAAAAAAAGQQHNGDYDNYGDENDTELNSKIKSYNTATRLRKLRFPSNSDSQNAQPSQEDKGSSNNRGAFVHFKDIDDDEREGEGHLRDSISSATIRRGKKLVFLDSQGHEKTKISELAWNHLDFPWVESGKLKEGVRGGKQIVFTTEESHRQLASEELTAPASPRLIFPDHYEKFIVRKGRILNRPTYAPTYAYAQNVRFATDDKTNADDGFVLPNTPQRLRRLQFQQSLASNYNSLASLRQEQQGFTHTINHDSYQQQEPPTSAPQHFLPTPSSNRQQYNYPNTNYISNSMRYSSDGDYNSNTSKIKNYNTNYYKYQPTSGTAQRTTQRPVYTVAPPTKHEDDRNVYITNGHGVTEYYLTPDGRKVYL